MNNIYVIADIHGSYKPIRDFYAYLNSSSNRNTKPDESDVLIIAGDAGLNYFFNYRDINLKKQLGKYKFTYFVIRGNHEERPSICAEKNPDKWEYNSFFGNYVWVEKEYPYIKYAMDYPEYYNIDGKDTFVYPGAYSVDKMYRIQNRYGWFPQEQLNEEEMNIGRKLLDNYGSCDLVLSHTCPIMYEPTDLFLDVVNQSFVDKTMERYLGEIEFNLNYRLWIFGHYHQSRIYPTNGYSQQMLMCYNNSVFNLNKYFITNDPYNSFIQFHKNIIDNKEIINDMR